MIPSTNQLLAQLPTASRNRMDALGQVVELRLSEIVGDDGNPTAFVLFHDRADGDQFRVTHEFLAYMLGGRRVGVTVAAGAFQRRNLIAYERGEMRIVDRTGLEHATCRCYARDRAAYAEQLD